MLEPATTWFHVGRNNAFYYRLSARKDRSNGQHDNRRHRVLCLRGGYYVDPDDRGVGHYGRSSLRAATAGYETSHGATRQLIPTATRAIFNHAFGRDGDMIEKVVTEGDYVIKSLGRDLMRFHFTDESMVVTTTKNSPQRNVIICDVSDAKELRDWLSRRLEEDIDR